MEVLNFKGHDAKLQLNDWLRENGKEVDDLQIVKVDEAYIVTYKPTK